MKNHYTTLNELLKTTNSKNSIKGICLGLALITMNLLNAQNANYEWAKKLGGTVNDEVRCLSVDQLGNTYTTGYFYQTADFDPGSGTSNLTSLGFYDAFISKLDAAGNYVWVKHLGSRELVMGVSIYADNAGYVYVTGHFTKTVDFDPGVGVTNITSAYARDAFILKLDASGNFIWVKTIGGLGNAYGISIHADATGNVYTTGTYSGTADLNPGSGTLTFNTNNSNPNVFVTKLNSAGNYLWSKSFGSTGSDISNSIAVDASGNVYTTGLFTGTVDFDPGNNTNNLSSNGAQDIFISKLNSSGNYIWAKNMGSTSNDAGTSIQIDAIGNVYTTGYFLGTVDFNPGTGTSNLVSSGSEDIFISKLNSLGNFVWAKRMGSTGSDKGFGLAIDAVGNILTTGQYAGTVDFDPGSGITNLSSNGNTDVFITKINPLGNLIWAKGVGGGNGDKGLAIDLDPSGNVYTTGNFWNTVDFDPGTNTNNLGSNGGTDAFVLKLSCRPSHGTKTVTTCDSYYFNGVYYSSNNNTAKDTLTNAAGCDSIITLNLTIQSVDATTSLNGNTIVANNTSTGVIYQWVDCDNNNAIIPGATGSTFTPTINGNYAVIVSYKDCKNISDCVNLSTVSINEIGNNTFYIFPNPASSKITIANYSSSIEKITIRDLSGKIILSTISKTEELDISHIQQGVYFIQLSHNGNVLTQRLIKK